MSYHASDLRLGSAVVLLQFDLEDAPGEGRRAQGDDRRKEDQ